VVDDDQAGRRAEDEWAVLATRVPEARRSARRNFPWRRVAEAVFASHARRRVPVAARRATDLSLSYKYMQTVEAAQLALPLLETATRSARSTRHTHSDILSIARA
jgi:hypothetical protein